MFVVSTMEELEIKVFSSSSQLALSSDWLPMNLLICPMSNCYVWSDGPVSTSDICNFLPFLSPSPIELVLCTFGELLSTMCGTDRKDKAVTKQGFFYLFGSLVNKLPLNSRCIVGFVNFSTSSSFRRAFSWKRSLRCCWNLGAMKVRSSNWF